jgi:hypothetical protein
MDIIIHSLSTVTHTNGGPVMSVDGGLVLEKGHLFSKEFEHDSELLEWLDKYSQSNGEHLVYVSRMPHRRLLNQIDVTKIETYWMTHRAGQAHISPDLDHLHALVQSRIHNHHGLIVVEGLEWLVSLHGESTLLNFIRTLRDDVHRTQWTLLLPVDALAFNSIWLARFKREAPELVIQSLPSEQAPTPVEEAIEVSNSQVEVTEEGLPQLVMLNRLPSNGFTRPLLRKRILQWRRMGLDVSEVEPALHMDDEDAFVLYSTVEQKVRTAVELERAIEHHKLAFTASELTTSKFRIRQLTGLEEIRVMIESI